MSDNISVEKSNDQSMRNLGKSLIADINGLRVSYTDDGRADSPVIIFVHGFPLNKTMWSSQVEALEKNYRVITYDIRGHGESEAGSERFSIELFADDLFRLMDELDIKKCVLCGLSMGGYIALHAIQKSPAKFGALILCDTQCNVDTPEVKEKRMSDIDHIKKSGLKEYAENNLKNLFMPVSLQSKKDEVESVKKMIREMSVQSLTDTLHALANRNETCEKLSKIEQPVLIIVGEEDNITPPSKGQFMQNKIKDSELKIVENAGHLSNLENAGQFNKYLNNFISSIYETVS